MIPRQRSLTETNSIGIDESVRRDVAKIQAWPFLPEGVPVLGYVFETENGGLRKVV